MADISPFAPFDRQERFESQLLKGIQSEKDLATQGAIQNALQRRVGHNTLLNTMEQGKNTLANTLGGLGVISPHGANLSGLPATPGGGDLLRHMRQAADARQFGEAIDAAAKGGALATPLDFSDLGAPFTFGQRTAVQAAKSGLPSTTDQREETSSEVGPDGGKTIKQTTTRKVPDPSGVDENVAREIAERRRLQEERRQQLGRGTSQAAAAPPAVPPAPAPAPAPAPRSPLSPNNNKGNDEMITKQVTKMIADGQTKFQTFDPRRDKVEIDEHGNLYVNDQYLGRLKHDLPPGYVEHGSRRVIHDPERHRALQPRHFTVQGLDLSNPPNVVLSP